MLPRLGEKNDIGSAVAFSPDGKTLATASRDNSIRLWNGATGKEVCRFIGHEKLIYSVAFAPDGKVLASAGDGELIRLWDVDKGMSVRLLKGFRRLQLQSVVFAGRKVSRLDWTAAVSASATDK